MPISEVPDRETIVLGCLYEFTSLLQKLVDDFNQISDQYEVVVETYADSGKYNDVMDAVTRINTEIAIGHAPDILVLASNYINLDSFAEKGVFVDLNEMIANSQMLKKEDILDSVISTFTYDKKLVGLPLFFSIDTLYGKTSVVGEKNGWTIQELKALMDEYPDRNIIKYAMKDDMLLSLISLNKDTFIDWENGRCYFDGNEFKELLELMNRFPASVDKEYFKNVEPLLYRHTVRLNNFQNYQLILAVMQEPVNFIGFPTPDGTKGIGLVEDGGVYTIISQSKHKEGAWAFIEYLLTQEIPFDSHFSVNKNVLDQQIERAKNGIYGYITDNFEPVPGPDGEMPLRSKVSISYDGEMIPIYAPTQEDIDEFYALIDSAVGIIPRSDDILKIISEEAAAYFIGIKTLDQVADIIQNRAQIYVSENQ
ncbi:MAG: extracellular solute-binding protein [Lachnospiraceae bacterium]|jgi:ABC-type glycerol-3-phosphate transport system substrate-binding protein|nr:extracellular solute-binding protein [Lachnospiraceae bacterium]